MGVVPLCGVRHPLGGESCTAMETRIVRTRFWKDEKVHKMSASAQHLFIYLLTCDSINLCGVFELPDDYISLEAKLDGNRLASAKKELGDLGRVRFHDGWVYVVNAQKYNPYHNSPMTAIAFKKEVSLIPKDILIHIGYTTDSTMDSTMDTPRNKKSEIRNKKPEIKNNLVNSNTVETDPLEKMKGLMEERGYIISEQES